MAIEEVSAVIAYGQMKCLRADKEAEVAGDKPSCSSLSL